MLGGPLCASTCLCGGEIFMFKCEDVCFRARACLCVYLSCVLWLSCLAACLLSEVHRFVFPNRRKTGRAAETRFLPQVHFLCVRCCPPPHPCSCWRNVCGCLFAGSESGLVFFNLTAKLVDSNQKRKYAWIFLFAWSFSVVFSTSCLLSRIALVQENRQLGCIFRKSFSNLTSQTLQECVSVWMSDMTHYY